MRSLTSFLSPTSAREGSEAAKSPQFAHEIARPRRGEKARDPPKCGTRATEGIGAGGGTGRARAGAGTARGGWRRWSRAMAPRCCASRTSSRSATTTRSTPTSARFEIYLRKLDTRRPRDRGRLAARRRQARGDGDPARAAGVGRPRRRGPRHERPRRRCARSTTTVAGGERVDRSVEALRALKPDEARALLLKAEGLSYQEIGRHFGWTYTKVNRSHHRGPRALPEGVQRDRGGRGVRAPRGRAERARRRDRHERRRSSRSARTCATARPAARPCARCASRARAGSRWRCRSAGSRGCSRAPDVSTSDVRGLQRRRAARSGRDADRPVPERRRRGRGVRDDRRAAGAADHRPRPEQAEAGAAEEAGHGARRRSARRRVRPSAISVPHTFTAAATPTADRQAQGEGREQERQAEEDELEGRRRRRLELGRVRLRGHRQRAAVRQQPARSRPPPAPAAAAAAAAASQTGSAPKGPTGGEFGFEGD